MARGQWMTVDEVQAIIGLNPAHDETIDFVQYITRAQVMDVKPLLGDRLYYDIDGDQTKTTNGNYPDLLDGVSYTYGGYSYYNEGLNKVIAYYTASHYRYDAQDVDTPYGFAEVQAANLQKSSRERNREMHIYYRELAEQYWKSVREYLIRKTAAYTLWNGDPKQEWDRSQKINTIQPVSLF